MAVADRTLSEKSGTLSPVAFSGSPKEAGVAFASAFPSSAYSVIVDIEVVGGRSFAHSIRSKTANGFVISLYADNIAGLVSVGWQAALEGET